MGKEKKFIIPGMIIASANGSVIPIFGYLMANYITKINEFGNFIDPTYTGTLSKKDVLWNCDKITIGLFGIAVGSFVVMFL